MSWEGLAANQCLLLFGVHCFEFLVPVYPCGNLDRYLFRGRISLGLECSLSSIWDVYMEGRLLSQALVPMTLELDRGCIGYRFKSFCRSGYRGKKMNFALLV